MSRFFEKLSLKEFESKLKDAWKKKQENKYDYEKSENINSDIVEFTSQIERDISKVSFSTENFTCDKHYEWNYENKEYEKLPSDDSINKIMGFSILPNGMPFLGCCGGGDWESGIFFIIYWSGKNFRGYIPKEGNPWNTKTNTAYGNDSDSDFRNLEKRFGIKIEDREDFEVCDVPDLDEGKIIDDIQKIIFENVKLSIAK